ncbi:MAG TPA: cupin domain-containing protein [Candidatus Limnocylindrales bacterium]|nr:cupin domain-containing protein [Candidatus Limnocylindrales bacterium]
MKAFTADLKELAEENDDFRRVVFTGQHSQLVLMALRPGEEIGDEVHSVDQILYAVDGEAQAIVAGDRFAFEKHDVVVVPAFQRHNIVNTGDEPFKLFTIYAPPEHPAGTVHHTRAQAMAAELVEV